MGRGSSKIIQIGCTVHKKLLNHTGLTKSVPI